MGDTAGGDTGSIEADRGRQEGGTFQVNYFRYLKMHASNADGSDKAAKVKRVCLMFLSDVSNCDLRIGSERQVQTLCVRIILDAVN